MIFEMNLLTVGIEDGEIIFDEFLQEINHSDKQGDNLLIKYFKSKKVPDPTVVEHILSRPGFDPN